MKNNHNKIINIPIFSSRIEVICKKTDEGKYVYITNIYRSNPNEDTVELLDDRDYGGYGG